MEKTYQKFINQVRSTLKSDPCCPLCYRKFEKINESEQLIRDMQMQIKGPEYRRKIDQDLVNLQEKFEKCLNLKPIHSQLQDLEDRDIPTLKNQIKQLEKEIHSLKFKQQEFEEQLNNDICLQCEQIQTDMIMLNKYLKEKQDLQEKIHVCQQKLGQISTTIRSLDEVKRIQVDLQNQFDQLDKNIQSKHKQIRSQQDRIQELRESLTELKNEKLKLSSDIQKKERLDEQLLKLTNSIQNLKQEIENEKQILEPIIVNFFELQKKRLTFYFLDEN